METAVFFLTWVHTLISFVAILSGLVVLRQLYASRVDRAFTQIFLVTAIVTSVSGYFFPFGDTFTPAQILGIIALIVLVVTLVARHVGRLAGFWRWVYVIGVVASEFLLLFVLVAQAFEHVSFLHPLAPTGSEPPLQIAALVVLLLCIALGIGAVRRFRPMAA